MAGAVPSAEAERLARAAQVELAGCSRIVIFDATHAVVHATFKVSPQTCIHVGLPVRCASPYEVITRGLCGDVQGVSKTDMQSLSAAVTGPREQAIRNGLCIQGKRYEVSVWQRSSALHFISPVG